MIARLVGSLCCCALGLVGVGIVGIVGNHNSLARAANPVETENEQPGARDWQLTRVRVDSEQFRSPWVEGYCNKQSVKAGETLREHLSVLQPHPAAEGEKEAQQKS